MPAGRPEKAPPGSLYAMAHMFYWEFRRLAEGSFRWKFDEKKYQELTAGFEDELQLVDDEDRARHQEIVDEEIRTGRLEGSQREARIRDIGESELFVRRGHYLRVAAEEARKQIKIPAEKEVIKMLLDPNTTAEQIRELCKDAFMTVTRKVGSETREIEDYPAWPIPVGSTLPGYLSEHAEQYVAALRHPRFPHCATSVRPTNRLKQLWFVSRALSGAIHGVKVRTAVNLVGSLRPEEVFEESRNAKRERKRKRQKYKLRRSNQAL
jgi:hypothetical protein